MLYLLKFRGQSKNTYMYICVCVLENETESVIVYISINYFKCIRYMGIIKLDKSLLNANRRILILKFYFYLATYDSKNFSVSQINTSCTSEIMHICREENHSNDRRKAMKLHFFF